MTVNNNVCVSKPIGFSVQKLIDEDDVLRGCNGLFDGTFRMVM